MADEQNQQGQQNQGGSGNNNDGGSGGQQQQQGQPNAGGKTFTQAELDQIIKDRLDREREKYKDFDALKSKAAEFDKLQDANKSELEKAQETARKAEEKGAAALSAANERLVRAEVKLIASQMGIIDPDAALALMDRSAVKVNDAGEVEGVKAALDKLVKDKAYLLGQNSGSGTSATNGARGGNQQQETDAQRRARVYGSGGSPFDPAAMRAMGGGVIFNNEPSG